MPGSPKKARISRTEVSTLRYPSGYGRHSLGAHRSCAVCLYFGLVSPPNTLQAINIANHTVTNITVGNFPFPVSVSPDGTRAYVGNSGDETVSVINTSDNTVIATFAAYDLPDQYAIAVSADGRVLYVVGSNSQQNEVLVIDTSTGRTTATIPLGAGDPSGVAVSPDGRRVYVANGYNGNYGTVEVIDAGTYEVTAVNMGNFGPFYVAVTPDSSLVYVTAGTGGLAEAIRASDLSVFQLAMSGSCTTFSADGTLAYVTYPSQVSFIEVVDTPTGGINYNVQIPLPDGAFPIAISTTPDGSQVYVADFLGYVVWVISTASNTVIASIPVGSNPEPLGIFIQPPWGSGGGGGGGGTSQPSKLLGDSCGKCKKDHKVYSPTAGDPIDIASGNVFYANEDNTTTGLNPLSFTR